MKKLQLAKLPKIDTLLASGAMARAGGELPHVLILKAARRAVEELRSRILAGEYLAEPELALDAVAARAAEIAAELARPSLRGVINATGVVVHTNLGRSLLAEAALQRLIELNRGYSNLEYDLQKGARGSRYDNVLGILLELTGAESGLVVNNNAAAVFLGLQTLAAGKEAIVSRGQLVEIGGSFRVPDIMARSGAVMVEVGTTNKTHLHDYANAIGENTGLLLKVHTSNYAVVGFHKEVPLEEMVALGREHGVPVMEDLGSGSLLDLSRLGLPKEPTVLEALGAGADLVTFSGDKLLGGPQAGIILGRADIVALLRKNPLNRALRPDKLTLAALEASLELYRDPEQAIREIPTLRMLAASPESLKAKAVRLTRAINRLGIAGLKAGSSAGVSRVGGGALPLAAPKTRLVRLAWEGLGATRLEEALRSHSRPVICRLEDGQLLLDVRTLQPGDGAEICRALERIALRRKEG